MADSGPCGPSPRVHCSKATLCSLTGTKEQLVLTITRRFFGQASEAIEAAVATEPDARQRIATYLNGVGAAMRREAPPLYIDMVGFRLTAQIYRPSSEAAAHRVGELVDDGMRQGVFR